MAEDEPGPADLIEFWVPGVPAQQGNHRRGRNGGIYETSKDHGPWRDSIIWAARAARADAGLVGPVVVSLTCWFPRPASHYGTGRNAGRLKPSAPMWKTTAPDVDKLARAALDGLWMGGVFRDDALVVRLIVEKPYVPHGGTPGLGVAVRLAR
jgi:crossover junction endodeoxyribonuclease RusA